VSMSGSEGEEALVSASKNGHEAIQEEEEDAEAGSPKRRCLGEAPVLSYLPHIC